MVSKSPLSMERHGTSKSLTKKLKNTSPYDFSLEEEVKSAEKEVKKDVAAEKAAAAQVKKDELAAKKAAEKEAAAEAAEKKVSSLL